MDKKISVKDTLKSAKDNGVDVKTFDTPRTWYRQGNRGALHLDKYCYKISNYRMQETVTSTILNSKGKICTDCFLQSIGVVNQNNFNILSNINFAYSQAEKLENFINSPLNAAVAIRKVSLQVEFLEKIKSTDETYEAIQVAIAILKEKSLKAKSLVEESKNSLSVFAALRVLDGGRTPLSQYNLNELLGAGQYLSNYETIWITWSETVQESMNFTKARELAKAKINPNYAERVSQFEGIPLNLLSNLDNSLPTTRVLADIWYQYAQMQIDLELNLWEDRFNSAFNDSELVYLTHHGKVDSSDKWLAAILGAYPLINLGGVGNLIKVPMVIAKYLSWNLGNYSISRNKPKIYSLDNFKTDEVFHTALSLWEPMAMSSNIYSDFDKALETALAL